MLRQAAFESTGNAMLKGGLHCHTTRSDGKGAPEEVIRYHVQHGYDFLALTDHNIYNFKNFAPDEKIIIIPGAERDRDFDDPGIHCFHTVCIGPAEGNGYQQDQRFESGSVRDQFDFQPVLDEIHANHNLTIYCHPEWSRTPAREFDQLRGNFAMEIWNSGCVLQNDMDTDAAYWDELLRSGQRIYGVATDDGHGMSEHCLGWVMVNAEPNVASILASLQSGAFYASCGPIIRDFYVEDGRAVVECSPASAIRFDTAIHPTRVFRTGDALLERAELPIPDRSGYVRVSVIDAQGRKAWSNPIFLDK